MELHPIIFSPEMIVAILEGRKTQTRRYVRPQLIDGYVWSPEHLCFTDTKSRLAVFRHCPYGAVGDWLWVREKFARDCPYEHECGNPDHFVYWASESNTVRDSITGSTKVHWKPSIHMPLWASRIILRVTEIRAERLQDITLDDVIAEGFKIEGRDGARTVARYVFSSYWDRLFKKRKDRIQRGWLANPWVWVVGFERLEGKDGIDAATRFNRL